MITSDSIWGRDLQSELDILFLDISEKTLLNNVHGPSDNPPFNCTTIVCKFLLGMVLSCTCFGLRPSNYFCCAPDKAGIGTILTSFVMTRCRTKIRNYHLHDNEQMRYVLRHCRWSLQYNNALLILNDSLSQKKVKLMGTNIRPQ